MNVDLLFLCHKTLTAAHRMPDRNHVCAAFTGRYHKEMTPLNSLSHVCHQSNSTTHQTAKTIRLCSGSLSPAFHELQLPAAHLKLNLSFSL